MNLLQRVVLCAWIFFVGAAVFGTQHERNPALYFVSMPVTVAVCVVIILGGDE